MPTVEQLVETTLKVTDKAVGPLEKIARSADHTKKALHDAEGAGEGFADKLFHGLKEVAGIASVVGGALAFHEAWESSEKYLKNIKEVHELTGATVSETDFLFSSARKAGVEYDTMNRIMFTLSKRGQALEETMDISNGKHVPGLAKKFQRLGVDMSKGPVKALESMSDAVKKGKVDVADLMKRFGIPASAANDFNEFLGTLDKSTLGKLQRGEKIPGLIGNADMVNFKKLEDAQHRIADAWNRIKVLVMSKLYPVVAGMAEEFAQKLERALPTVQKIGETIAAHMDQIVFAAKMFVTYMTAKKLWQTLEKIDVAGSMLGKMAGGAGGKGIAGIVGAVVEVLGKSQTLKKMGMGAAGGVGNLVGQLGGSAGLAGVMGQIAGAAAMILPVLVGVAAAIGVLYLGFRAFQKNIDGVRDRIEYLWDSIKTRFELIGAKLDSIFQRIAKVFGGGEGGFMKFLEKIADFVGLLVASGVELFLKQLDMIILVFQVGTGVVADAVDEIVKFYDGLVLRFKVFFADPLGRVIEALGKIVSGSLTNDIAKVALGMYDMKRAVTGLMAARGAQKELAPLNGPKLGFSDLLKSAVKNFNEAQTDTENAIIAARFKKRQKGVLGNMAPEEREKAPVFDFRGSKFDITQNFAEGFDPDRIAVTMANDLSSMGEMKAQSGFAPLFSAR